MMSRNSSSVTHRWSSESALRAFSALHTARPRPSRPTAPCLKGLLTSGAFVRRPTTTDIDSGSTAGYQPGEVSDDVVTGGVTGDGVDGAVRVAAPPSLPEINSPTSHASAMMKRREGAARRAETKALMIRRPARWRPTDRADTWTPLCFPGTGECVG